PEDRPAASAIGELARLLGGAPCAAALVRRALLLQALMQLDLDPTARHVLRMVLDVAANDRLALVVMDGELGGRLAWGWIRRLGLAGFRVPTLLVAAPVADPAEAERAIQRVLDVNNARYRAAFTLRPVPVPPATIYVLESAGGDEWVDELSPSDRPAYVVLHGWLLASSNLAALQKLAQTAAEEREAAETPAWAAAVDGSAGAAAWLDLARSHRVAKDAVAYARLAVDPEQRGHPVQPAAAGGGHGLGQRLGGHCRFRAGRLGTPRGQNRAFHGFGIVPRHRSR
ncbi:MAG TPA: hypothetical protein PKU89_11215, partial [Kiritimatiellia bacterium]|nr:hypothetical protein [Kiritimatiellia bacterium]